MALILNIDTSSPIAEVALAEDGNVIAQAHLDSQKDHAGWIHSAISEILNQQALSVRGLDAVAVAAGPGSYTGLRVGMATAKGLRYSARIPLITESTLKIMALAAVQRIQSGESDLNKMHRDQMLCLCPMIDARRMEVFTALFDIDLNIVNEPAAVILDETTFNQPLNASTVLFFGSGAKKFKQLVINDNALFCEIISGIEQLAQLSENKYLLKDFSDVAYSEPQYLKAFHDTRKH